jgi:DNA-binding FadR family transcriptional regulator
MNLHMLIRNICPNPVLDLTAEAVGHLYATRTAAGGANSFAKDTRMHLHLDHIRIADAISRGDPDAARDLMREHTASSAKAIFEAFPGLEDQLVDWQ